MRAVYSEFTVRFGESPRDWFQYAKTRPRQFQDFDRIPWRDIPDLSFAKVNADLIAKQKLPFLKWLHYFPIYNRLVEELRRSTENRKITVLEIGVDRGGSLEFFERLFASNVSVYGLDINTDCKKIPKYGSQIWIGNQGDVSILQDIVDTVGKFDLVIDDGSHNSKDVITTFHYLFEYLSDQGIYLIEDTHASYWPYWNLKGGLRRNNSMVEYFKNYVDVIHQPYFKATASLRRWRKLVRSDVGSVEFQDSLIVIRKKQKVPVATLVDAGEANL